MKRIWYRNVITVAMRARRSLNGLPGFIFGGFPASFSQDGPG
jgi:hypothetical protein